LADEQLHSSSSRARGAARQRSADLGRAGILITPDADNVCEGIPRTTRSWKRRGDFGSRAAVTYDNHSRSLWRLSRRPSYFASVKMKIGCAKFLRFEFNRRIAGANVSESLTCMESSRRKFRRAA
jgi:hypothetical protein